MTMDELFAWRDEPLREELRPFLYTTENGFEVFHHPLHIQVVGVLPGLANRVVSEKVKQVAEARERRAWHRYVFLHERPYRLGALSDIADDMPDDEFWSLVGQIWTDSENIAENLYGWSAVFECGRAGREHIMTEDDREKLANLPETLTIYRGCREGENEEGMSWTLDRERGEWFAGRFLWNEDASPLLIRATVKKSDVIAYITTRGEEEIILPLDTPLDDVDYLAV